VGTVKSAKVMLFILQWGWLGDKLKREPTIGEYAQYAALKPAQAVDRKALFQKCFPMVDSPSPIWETVKDRISATTIQMASIELSNAPAFSAPPTTPGDPAISEAPPSGADGNWGTQGWSPRSP